MEDLIAVVQVLCGIDEWILLFEEESQGIRQID